MSDSNTDNDDLAFAVQRRVHDRFSADAAAWDGAVTRRAMDEIRAGRSSPRPNRLSTMGAPLGALVALGVIALVVATQLPSSSGSSSPIVPDGSADASRTNGVGGPAGTSRTVRPADPSPSPSTRATESPDLASPTAPPSPVIHAGEFGRLLLPVPVFAQTDASGEPIQLLDRGRDLWAPQDAEVVDGSLWYRVQFRRLLGAGEYMFGWLPGIWEGQAVFRLHERECYELRPITMAVLGMAALTPPERRFCFANRELQVVGTIQPFDARDPYYRVRPGWLGSGAASLLEGRMGSAAEGGAFQFQVDPASGITAPGSDFVRITGHFNDPVSSDCVVEPPPGYPVLLPGESEAWCRQRFVVTNMEPAMDPWAP